MRNNEAQYYTRDRQENARVENGLLVIEGRKEKFKNPEYAPDKKGRRGQEFADYTSASVTTRTKASWTYGRIEVKAKLPKGRGTWPAIWMLGTDCQGKWVARLRRDRYHGIRRSQPGRSACECAHKKS